MAMAARFPRESYSCAKPEIADYPDLTPEERLWVIEQSIGRHHTGRLERVIHEAPTRETAIKILRDNERYHGLSDHGWCLSGHADGIVAWLEEWEQYETDKDGFGRFRFVRGLRSAFVPWGEIVDFVRNGTTVAVQARLF